jgi:hypothetical protein
VPARSVLWVPRRTIPASLAASAAMTTTTAKYYEAVNRPSGDHGTWRNA